MEKQTYIDDLQSKARLIDRKLKAAKEAIERGDTAPSAESLKEVSWLETRQKDLIERLDAAEEKHAGSWSEWHKGLREDFDGMIDALERLIVKST